MARTEKDRPYEVRAKEASKGVIKHHRYCNGLPHRWESYTRVTTHIFHAHEVKEMEAFKEEIAETDSEIKITEKSGYLISQDPNIYSFYLQRATKRPIVREKVVATLSGPRGDSIVSSFDIFYIFEVSKTVDNKDETACCGATLPKAVDRNECSCCKGFSKKEQSKAEVRAELDSLRKEAYAGIEEDSD